MIKKETLFDLAIINIMIIVIALGGWALFNKFGVFPVILVFIVVVSFIFMLWVSDKDDKKEEEKEKREQFIEEVESKISILLNLSLLVSCKNIYSNEETVTVIKALFRETVKDITRKNHSGDAAKIKDIISRLNHVENKNICYVMADIFKISAFRSTGSSEWLQYSRQVKELNKLLVDTEAGLIRWEEMHGCDLTYRGYLTDSNEKPDIVISLDSRWKDGMKYMAIPSKTKKDDLDTIHLHKETDLFLDILVSAVRSKLFLQKQQVTSKLPE